MYIGQVHFKLLCTTVSSPDKVYIINQSTTFLKTTCIVAFVFHIIVQCIFVKYIYKIPIKDIIIPGLIFFQKALLVGLFSEGLISVIGGNLAFQNELDFNKNSLKHDDNSLKQLTLTVYGLIFGTAYCRKDICV